MIPIGTPVEAVPDDAGWQSTAIVAPGVSEMVGINTAVARRVAAETGDPISWPFGTLAWVRDADLAAAVLVFHGFTGPGSPVCLSALVYELPITRRMLLSVLSFVLDEIRASAILARATIADLPRSDVLKRFGFVCLGSLDETSLVYRLDLAALPPRIARSRRRRAS